MRCLRHSIQAIFWKVLGSGIERAYFFTVLIEADTKKENEENHFKTEQRFELFG